MLWRALGHIQHGVYVDVGAQHPRIDSISRAFYEHGWRGVHIEPVPAFAEMLRQDRPDETVLQMAIGAAEGTVELNVFADTGLSTAIRDYADRHQSERGYEVQRLTVPVLTLNTALRSLEGKDVHWLKIDVEGFEEQVLRGWQSDTLRPWVLVVEATIPNSPDTDYESWDPIVTAAGYRFVYFDGLNRFYIANEHPELADAFQVPPNIFDGVEVSGQASWGLYDYVAAAWQGKLDQLGNKLAEAEAAAREQQGQLQVQVDALRGQHEAAQRALASSVAHVEWMQGRQDAETARLNAHIAWMQGQFDKEEARLHAHIAWMQGQLDTALRSSHEATAQAEALRQQVSALHASTSWRLTAPLRRAINLARRIKRKLLGTPAPAPYVAAQAAPAAFTRPDEQAPRELSPRAARILAEIRAVAGQKAS